MHRAAVGGDEKIAAGQHRSETAQDRFVEHCYAGLVARLEFIQEALFFRAGENRDARAARAQARDDFPKALRRPPFSDAQPAADKDADEWSIPRDRGKFFSTELALRCRQVQAGNCALRRHIQFDQQLRQRAVLVSGLGSRQTDVQPPIAFLFQAGPPSSAGKSDDEGAQRRVRAAQVDRKIIAAPAQAPDERQIMPTYLRKPPGDAVVARDGK